MRTQNTPVRLLSVIVVGAFVALAFGSGSGNVDNTPPAPSTTTPAQPAEAEQEEEAAEVAPAEPPRPRTLLEQHAAVAISPDEFDRRLEGKEWTFFPRGVRPCNQDEDREYLPPGGNEFERRASEQRREHTRDELVGTAVRFSASGVLEGADAVYDTINVDDRFYFGRSAYDFRHHRYRMSIVADSDGSGMFGTARWPICERGRCRPTIRPQRYREQVYRTIGRVGGEDVDVASTISDTEWQNFSNITINVPMSEEQASQYASRMPVAVTFVMRFESLTHHQRCHRSCEVFFGERMWYPFDGSVADVRAAFV